MSELPLVKVEGWPDPTELAQRLNRAIIEHGRVKKDPQASVGEVCGAATTIILGYIDAVDDRKDREEVLAHVIGIIWNVFQSREKGRDFN